jgi:hypothetical protein
MSIPWTSTTVLRGSTPKLLASVFRPNGDPESGLSGMTLLFTMQRRPEDRDARQVTKAIGTGITVGTGGSSHIATIALDRADLELGDAHKATKLAWDLFAEAGGDRIPLARGEIVVLPTPSEY